MIQESGQRSMAKMRMVAIAVAAGLSFGSVAVMAQDADTSRPASIHVGTCDSPGEVVAELNPLTVSFDDDDNGAAQDTDTGDDTGDDSSDDIGDDNADDTGDDIGDDNADDTGTGTGDDNADDTGDDNADDSGTGDDTGDDNADDGGDDDGEGGSTDRTTASRLSGVRAFQGSGFGGAEDASVVEGSEDSDAGVALDALLAEPHIVAVFESEGSDTIIACGSIGGFVSGDDDDLAVGLRAQNGSGFAGIAILDDDDDDANLDVDIYIARDVA